MPPHMKKREQENQLVYGIHAVEEAIQEGKEFERIYIIKDGKSDVIKALRSEIRSRRLPVHEVPVHKLNRLTRGNHQGIVAFMSIVPNVAVNEVVMRAFESGEQPRILLLDNITDVRNFGALSRSAVAFGYHGIVIPYKGSALIHADAIKASAGGLMKISVCRVASLVATTRELQDSGLEVYAITEKSDDLLGSHDTSGPHVLVVGSEEKGIAADLLNICNQKFSIPMTNQMESLNVSVAGAIAMYHCRASSLTN